MKYDKPTRQAVFARLPRREAVAMGLLAVERMLPQYRRFADETGRSGGFARLREVADALWEHVLGGPLPEERTTALLAMVEELIPSDQREPYQVWMYYASDAATALAHVLDYILDKDPDGAAEACARAYASVHEFVHRLIDARYGHDTDAAERAVREHPIVVAEAERQLRDGEELRHLGANDTAALRKLRERAAAESARFFEITS